MNLTQLRRILVASAVVTFSFALTACGGSKPSAEVQVIEDQSAQQNAVPKLSEEEAAAQTGDIKTQALKLEEENHQLRQELYQAKVKLGLDADSGIPETTDKPAAAEVKAPEAAKAATPAAKKKKK